MPPGPFRETTATAAESAGFLVYVWEGTREENTARTSSHCGIVVTQGCNIKVEILPGGIFFLESHTTEVYLPVRDFLGGECNLFGFILHRVIRFPLWAGSGVTLVGSGPEFRL